MMMMMIKLKMKELTVISCFPLFLPHLSQIPIATSGIRAMGYMMRHHLRTEGGAAVSQRTINQFVKVLLPEGRTRSQSTSAGEEVAPGRSLCGSIGEVTLQQLLQLLN